MTSVNPVASAAAANEAGGARAAQEQLTVDYNAFLQLMMTQMKNQDPTKPMDASEQLAAIGDFSRKSSRRFKPTPSWRQC
jgi:flagellar basal-body rod modification protein FlgD